VNEEALAQWELLRQKIKKKKKKKIKQTSSHKTFLKNKKGRG